MKSFNYKEFLKIYNQIEQRSEEWYTIRKQIITATDAGTILGYNIFSSKSDLLKKKLSNTDEMISNSAIEHGIYFEPYAIKYYEQLNNIKIHNIGLINHLTLNWLGASPDGIMENGKLIEIKCLYSRQFKNSDEDIPMQYWIQIQIQLEVCNLEECDLFQCIFKNVKKKEYDNFDGYKGKQNIKYWILKEYRCSTIKRDRKWFILNKNKLYDFWTIIEHEKNNKKLTQRIKRIKNNLGIDNTWINIIKIKNWMLNDPLIDWLNMYKNKSLMDKKPDIKYNFQYNIECKKNDILQTILTNFKNRFEVVIISDNKVCSSENYKKTINNIKKGTQIIYNGVLHDETTKLYGICNFIIRNDILKNICSNYIYSYNSESSKRYYSVVQFKYSTLNLNKNGFINKKDTSNYYKGECLLLQEILNKIQNNINECYILSKYVIIDNNKYIGFKQLGIIDPLNNKKDNELLIMAKDAISWIKKVKEEGKDWTVNTKPSIIELYPNMSNKCNDWNTYKNTIANNINELTLLKGIGYDKRKALFKNNIYDWNDSKLISNIKTNENLCNILSINKSNNNNINIINKEIFEETLETDTIKFYIDFETINNYNTEYSEYLNFNSSVILNKIENEEIIYLIGVGHEIDNKWYFKKFMANKISYIEEKNIINNWLTYINNVMQEQKFSKMKLYHWTNAEIRMLNTSCNRHKIKHNLNWYDLNKLFNNNVFIKNVFDYSLKTIAKEMKKHNMIKTIWDSNELNGLSTMVAIENYNKENKNLSEINEVNNIIKYNEVDCKVMWEMLSYIHSKL